MSDFSSHPGKHGMSLHRIGAAYAERLARRGYDLTIVARNRQRLDALAARISDDTGRAVEVFVADLRKREDLGRVEVALMHLTYAAASVFAARGYGAIINISSVAAIAPEMLNGVYGGTKAFVLTFSQSLHREFADKGV